jgi:hypothetical protein
LTETKIGQTNSDSVKSEPVILTMEISIIRKNFVKSPLVDFLDLELTMWLLNNVFFFFFEFGHEKYAFRAYIDSI